MNLNAVGLGEQMLKNLQDKSKDKRQQAAKQLQADIEDLAQRGDMDPILNKIATLTHLTRSD